MTAPTAPGLPWPAAGDVLFKDDEPDWRNNACFYFGISDETRIDGFKLAADMLVAAIEAEPVDQDVLVYPVIFNYRQYLELRLKALRAYGFDLYDWSISGGLNHKLLPIWTDCKKVITAHFPGEDPADATAVEALIKEFDKVDPDSFTFRYATTKQGAPSLSTSMKRVNVRHLRDTMAKIATFLEGATMGVMDSLSHKSAITP